MQYALLATEGMHDQAVLSSLLRLLGLKSFSGEPKFLQEEAVSFWTNLFPKPTKYPQNIYKRLDLLFPRILTSATHSVAVYQGNGSSLPQNLVDIFGNYDQYVRGIAALGVFVDADTHPPVEIAKKYARKLHSNFPMLSDQPGEIVSGEPRTGIYVLPDNRRTRYA